MTTFSRKVQRSNWNLHFRRSLIPWKRYCRDLRGEVTIRDFSLFPNSPLPIHSNTLPSPNSPKPTTTFFKNLFSFLRRIVSYFKKGM